MREHTNGLSRRAFIGGAVMLGAASIVAPTTAFATTAAEKQAEADAVRNQLVGLQADLEAAADSYKQALDAQEVAQAAMEAEQVKIDEANGKIADLQDKLGTRARSMYRTGGNTFLDVILGASTFEEFATNWNMLNTMNENDAELVAKTKESREKVEAAKVEYEQQEQVAAQKASEAKAIKDEAEATTAQMQETYDNLNAEVQELMRQEEEARSAANAAAAQEAIANNNGGGSHNGNSGNSSKPTNDSKPQTITGNVVVDRAYAQLGKPYKWGAAGPNSFDCSGLVGYCLTGKMGNHWCTTGTIQGWTRVSNPQPGDICINDHHTGIYIGGGQMIHAPQTGDVVKVSGVHKGMWYVRY